MHQCGYFYLWWRRAGPWILRCDDRGGPQGRGYRSAITVVTVVPYTVVEKDLTIAAALLDRPQLIQRLRALDLRPNKALGQNFLTDPAVLTGTVDAAELTRDDHILEIGPGPGVLTVALLERAGRVTSVEVDRRMLAMLEPLRERHPHLRLVEGNILAMDPDELVGPEPYKVVANIPYYITSNAIRHFLMASHKPERLVLMLQREVAERICARPNDMSILAVSVQIYAEPVIVMQVPRESFYPSPQVDSALLNIPLRAVPLVAPERERRFFRLVRAAFHDKRKMLHNSFARNLGANRMAIDAMLAEAEIAPNRRAETVSLDEWLRLLAASEHQIA